MIEHQPTDVVETPADLTPEVIEAPLAESIADHAAQYDPKRQAERDKAAAIAPETGTPASTTTTEATAAEPKQKHRAAKDRATAADAPRIQELNRKLKEAEERIQRLSAPPAAPPAAPAPAQATNVPPAGARWLGDPKNDPEPQEKDFGGDPMKYLSARFQWEARGVNRYERAEAAQQHQVLQESIAWGERVEKALTKYTDFAQVAFQPAPWRTGSAIDRFIMEDDNGADVLYHLASNPEERDAVLRLPPIQQLKRLTLISQRYDTASPSAAQPGTTGSGARANIRIMPARPVNPVRTGAQSASGGPPPTDGSLSVAEHRKSFGRQRR